MLYSNELEPKQETQNQEAQPDVDNAWIYLNCHVDASGEGQNLSVKAIRRKVDWHMVPLMFGCYAMQFLDKVVLNYAAVMGIQKDLELKGNEFSNIATFLFVGRLCFHLPNTYILQIFPTSKWLGANVILWGIATACGAAAHDYQTLLVSRILLGIFEATIGPSLLLISAQWYTKSEQAPRFAFWYCGVGIGQIIGGAISYGFQHVDPGAAVAGWRIMFIALGCLTVLIGIGTVVVVPDTPMQATWLSDAEKVAILKHVSVNLTGVQNRKFRPRQILEAVLDPQVYLIALAAILQSVSSGVITTYSATLIQNLGYRPKQAALMNMPSGVVCIFFTLLVGFGIRKQSNRWLWVLACVIPALTGGALMSFSPITNRSGCLAGLYLVNAVVAPLPVLYAWTAANISGATKRAFAAVIVSASFSIGNIVGPQTFQARDGPDYRPAKLAVMGTQAGCAMVTVALHIYYRWENGRRDRRLGIAKEDEGAYMSQDTWASLTDRENPKFRYCY